MHRFGLRTPTAIAQRLEAFNFSRQEDIDSFETRVASSHPTGAQQLQPEFLMVALEAVTQRCARHVWAIETDVALTGGSWLHKLQRLDWELASVDYIGSKMMVYAPEYVGNLLEFFHAMDVRRMEHWVARFSSRFLKSVRDYVRRGLWGSPQQVLPTVCAATRCIFYDISFHLGNVLRELWDWSPSCTGD